MRQFDGSLYLLCLCFRLGIETIRQFDGTLYLLCLCFRLGIETIRQFDGTLYLLCLCFRLAPYDVSDDQVERLLPHLDHFPHLKALQ